MSTHSRLVNIINKGKGTRCSLTGVYYPLSETNPDGKGGRIAKIHDFFVHNQDIEQSRFKTGKNWQRGIN